MVDHAHLPLGGAHAPVLPQQIPERAGGARPGERDARSGSGQRRFARITSPSMSVSSRAGSPMPGGSARSSASAVESGEPGSPGAPSRAASSSRWGWSSSCGRIRRPTCTWRSARRSCGITRPTIARSAPIPSPASGRRPWWGRAIFSLGPTARFGRVTGGSSGGELGVICGIQARLLFGWGE